MEGLEAVRCQLLWSFPQLNCCVLLQQNWDLGYHDWCKWNGKWQTVTHVQRESHWEHSVETPRSARCMPVSWGPWSIRTKSPNSLGKKRMGGFFTSHLFFLDRYLHSNTTTPKTNWLCWFPRSTWTIFAQRLSWLVLSSTDQPIYLHILTWLTRN